MARYNDTDNTIKAIRERFQIFFEVPCDGYDRRVQEIIGKVIEVIQNQPQADGVPKVIGNWKPYRDNITRRQTGWVCSNCSAVTNDLSNGDTDYCPHCGAIMETEEK